MPYTHETVTEVTHWSDNLFSFRTTRSTALRFHAGQFVMLGLEVEGRPLVRAYSIASAPYDDYLEFYSIKMPDGPLTSRLQTISEGAVLLVGTKPVGTLLLDNLTPGRNLWLLSTGTGIAPFCSILKDPAVYVMFERTILVHGCRRESDIRYGQQMISNLVQHELVAEEAKSKLAYLTTLTREPHAVTGRISELMTSGQLWQHLGVAEIDPQLDRAMLCGGPGMLADLDQLLRSRNFVEGSSSTPGSYVIEKAFVER